jgi:hypothetical protein
VGTKAKKEVLFLMLAQPDKKPAQILYGSSYQEKIILCSESLENIK